MAGRLVGVMLIALGITVLAMFTGLVASIFVEDRLKGAKGLKNITDSQHVVICGWNDAAENMLRSLSERLDQNKPVVLVGNYTLDFFESLQARFSTIDLKFVRGEPSQEEVLRRANVPGAYHIFILADNALAEQSADDRVVIIANAVHYLVNEHKRITVQLISSNNKNLLRRLGIENILIYEELGGFILANNALEKNSLNLYENLLREKRNVVQTMMIPSMFVGRTYVELFQYMYQHEGHLMMGIFTEQPSLGLHDIFSDDDSGIDSFIRHALEKSQSLGPEIKSNIQIHPPKNYIIQPNDKALLIC
jgi:voltage-gated potassium channel